jgi:hypothetical protein
MRAERFYGDADGPGTEIDRATDGTPLPDCQGWECWGCGNIFVKREDAEACCADVAAEREAERQRWLAAQPDADQCHRHSAADT